MVEEHSRKKTSNRLAVNSATKTVGHRKPGLTLRMRNERIRGTKKVGEIAKKVQERTLKCDEKRGGNNMKKKKTLSITLTRSQTFWI